MGKLLIGPWPEPPQTSTTTFMCRTCNDAGKEIISFEDQTNIDPMYRKCCYCGKNIFELIADGSVKPEL